MMAEMPEASLPDNNSHTMEERRAPNDTTALTLSYSNPRCLMEGRGTTNLPPHPARDRRSNQATRRDRA